MMPDSWYQQQHKQSKAVVVSVDVIRGRSEVHLSNISLERPTSTSVYVHKTTNDDSSLANRTAWSRGKQMNATASLSAKRERWLLDLHKTHFSSIQCEEIDRINTQNPRKVSARQFNECNDCYPVVLHNVPKCVVATGFTFGSFGTYYSVRRFHQPSDD